MRCVVKYDAMRCGVVWRARSPHFGVAHAMCLGLAPWMAAEIPYMVDTGVITAKV